MADPKQTERQKRYHVRKKAQAMALFAHATEIELAWFGVNRDGEHIAIGYDGKPIELVVRAGATLPDLPRPEDTPVDEVSAQRQKRVYAPKSWDASRWNKGRAQIIDEKMTKERAHEAAEHTKNITDKQRKHLLAVIDALPDTPDWYTLLPVADES